MNASEVRPGQVSARDHVRGANDAIVTIIEYADFECPSCKQAASAVALLLKRFQGRVRMIFRHFPLEAVYPNALSGYRVPSCLPDTFWRFQIPEAMRERYGEHLWQEYGFLDAFNPTLREPVRTQHGHVVPGVGWFDGDYLGIDQGPIVAMIENHRSDLVWRLM